MPHLRLQQISPASPPRKYLSAAHLPAYRLPACLPFTTNARHISGVYICRYINIGTLDLFLDEDVQYALELQRAGVSCELHVYPGQFHGSNLFVADHPTSVRWAADEADFVTRALAGGNL